MIQSSICIILSGNFKTEGYKDNICDMPILIVF